MGDYPFDIGACDMQRSTSEEGTDVEKRTASVSELMGDGEQMTSSDPSPSSNKNEAQTDKKRSKVGSQNASGKKEEGVDAEKDSISQSASKTRGGETDPRDAVQGGAQSKSTSSSDLTLTKVDGEKEVEEEEEEEEEKEEKDKKDQRSPEVNADVSLDAASGKIMNDARPSLKKGQDLSKHPEMKDVGDPEDINDKQGKERTKRESSSVRDAPISPPPPEEDGKDDKLGRVNVEGEGEIKVPVGNIKEENDTKDEDSHDIIKTGGASDADGIVSSDRDNAGGAQEHQTKEDAERISPQADRTERKDEVQRPERGEATDGSVVERLDNTRDVVEKEVASIPGATEPREEKAVEQKEGKGSDQARDGVDGPAKEGEQKKEEEQKKEDEAKKAVEEDEPKKIKGTNETVPTDVAAVPTDITAEDGARLKKKDEEKAAESVEGQVPKPEEEVDEEEGKGEEKMPSFDEWKKKKLEETQSLDKELSHSGQSTQQKFNLNENSKNHASADCGAKILGTNPEAQSASAILNINRDLYMLNPCHASSIWFVVELCEPIQVKLLELANFELFSNVPESFKVSISDRYPVREWHLLGTFLARDERALQSFPISEEIMFAKYMKVEMLTFFGSEHFCPLSVLRVFGTSMVEEIDEAEGDNSDHGAASLEQEDIPSFVLDSQNCQIYKVKIRKFLEVLCLKTSSCVVPIDVLPVHPTPLAEDIKGNGILDHAKDAVFKLVEKAAKVFTGTQTDEETFVDNVTKEDATAVPGDLPKEESSGKSSNPFEEFEDAFSAGGNDSFKETRDGCNGQAVCFQENYSTHFQHCCLSLFAHTAGSILICCKAIRRATKPLEEGEESVEGKSKLVLPGEPGEMPSSIRATATTMMRTETDTEMRLPPSVVLEPTPYDSLMGGGMVDKMEISSPPSLTLYTKTSCTSKTVEDTAPRDVLATSSDSRGMLKTAAPSQDVGEGDTNQKDAAGDKPIASSQSSSEGNMDTSHDPDIKVLPIPPPPTEDLGGKAVSADEDAIVVSKEEEFKIEDPGQKKETKVSKPQGDSSAPLSEKSDSSTSSDKLIPPTESTRIAEKDSSSPQVDAKSKDATGKNKDAAPKKFSIAENASDQSDKETVDKASQDDSTVAKDKTPPTQTASNKTISPKTQKEEEVAADPPKSSTASGSTATPGNGSINNKSAAEASNGAAPSGSASGSFSPSASSLSVPHGAQKESVLMRLNNRIKTLEINMSLSSLYLEELSQRYRKQMDEMQKAFNKKVKTIQEGAQKAQEVRQQQAEHIERLEAELKNLTVAMRNMTSRMDGILREVVERHFFLMLCEVVVMLLLFTYCLKRTRRGGGAVGMETVSGRAHKPVEAASKESGRGAAAAASSVQKQPVEEVGRRNSDGLLHVPVRDRLGLSPGLSAGLGMLKTDLNTKTGSLDDLLIIGPTTPLREALRQASEPSKQKHKNKNKGRHKNNQQSQQRPASASSAYDHQSSGALATSAPSSSSLSSSSSLASLFSLSSSSSSLAKTGAAAAKHSTAGLLFRGPAGTKKKGQGGGEGVSKQGTGGGAEGRKRPPEVLGEMNGAQQGSRGTKVNGWNGGGSGGSGSGGGRQSGGNMAGGSGGGRQSGGNMAGGSGGGRQSGVNMAGGSGASGGGAGRKQSQHVNGYSRR
ncbi:uncharacterized protein [Diadema antillarum]|uniref:uncharacterized protein n=1 Tax=Diadema antillarum TaxID=105358 RepID=UPI003A8B9CC3